jgi:hypothetical protein
MTFVTVEGIPSDIRSVIVFNLLTTGVVVAVILLTFTGAAQRWGFYRAGGYTYLTVFGILPLALIAASIPLSDITNPRSMVTRKRAEALARLDLDEQEDDEPKFESRRPKPEPPNDLDNDPKPDSRRVNPPIPPVDERNPIPRDEGPTGVVAGPNGSNTTRPPRDADPSVSRPKVDIAKRFGRMNTPSGIDFALGSRNYWRAALIDAIAGPDAELMDRLKWIPGMKRPLIGVRFGVGACLSGARVQPTVTSLKDLERITGHSGPLLVTRLQEQIDAGQYGEWPSIGDALYRQVVCLGGGTYGDLRERAEAGEIDVVVMFLYTRQIAAGSGRQSGKLTVRVADLRGKAEVFNSDALTTADIAAANQTGRDVVTPFVDKTLDYIEKSFAVKDLPTLTPTLAAKRADALAAAEKDQPLPALVELRCYHAMGWIDDETATRCCDALLGSSAGDSIMLGDEESRRAALEKP